MNQNYRRVEIAHENMFHWIWNPSKDGLGFVTWLEKSESIYWISAKPGSGKSTFMKYVSNIPNTSPALRLWHKIAIPARFFFHDQGDQDERSLHRLRCALLRLRTNSNRIEFQKSLIHNYESNSLKSKIKLNLTWFISTWRISAPGVLSPLFLPYYFNTHYLNNY